MTTDRLAAHLRQTWSYEGLEVVGISDTAVTVAVGPVFPVSELCMDVCDPALFDAAIVLLFATSGCRLVITPTGRGQPAPGSLWPVLRALAWLAAAAALSLAAPALLPGLWPGSLSPAPAA